MSATANFTLEINGITHSIKSCENNRYFIDMTTAELRAELTRFGNKYIVRSHNIYYDISSKIQ